MSEHEPYRNYKTSSLADISREQSQYKIQCDNFNPHPPECI